MTPRIKKLIGTVLILLWIPVYILFFLGLARLVLPHAGGFGSFAFIAIAGVLWAVPVGMLFPWMYREPKPKG
jgi:uncharacterized protein DUF2842